MPGVSGYKESRYNLYWPQRKLDLYQKVVQKRVHIYSSSITYLKISPSAQNFPNYSCNFYMDQLAFSS